MGEIVRVGLYQQILINHKKQNSYMMEDTTIERDLGYYCIEIIRDKGGKPLIIVKFKDEGKEHWVKEHSWCPTSAELEFLYRTMKWIKNNSKTKIPDVSVPNAPAETT